MQNSYRIQPTLLQGMIVLPLMAAIFAVGWSAYARNKRPGPSGSLPAPLANSKPQRLHTEVAQEAATSGWHTLAGHRKIECPVFSPDGKLLAAIADGRILYLLDVERGIITQEVSDGCCTISSVDFSRDGRQIALAMNSRRGARIKVLGALHGRYGTLISEFAEEGNLVHSVAFSHDGQRLLTEIDSSAILWNLTTGTQERHLEAGVNGLSAMSPDPRTIVTAGSNASEVTVWDLPSERPRFTLVGHTEGLLSITISRDGALAASGGYDATARVWDLRNGAPKRVFTHGEGNVVCAVAFSNSGSTLATASDVVRIWNVNTGATEHRFAAEHVSSLAYSPDDRLLVSTSDEGGLILWRLQ